jgi:hypothetical protein
MLGKRFDDETVASSRGSKEAERSSSTSVPPPSRPSPPTSTRHERPSAINSAAIRIARSATSPTDARTFRRTSDVRASHHGQPLATALSANAGRTLGSTRHSEPNRLRQTNLRTSSLVSAHRDERYTSVSIIDELESGERRATKTRVDITIRVRHCCIIGTVRNHRLTQYKFNSLVVRLRSSRLSSRLRASSQMVHHLCTLRASRLGSD